MFAFFVDIRGQEKNTSEQDWHNKKLEYIHPDFSPGSDKGILTLGNYSHS